MPGIRVESRDDLPYGPGQSDYEFDGLVQEKIDKEAEMNAVIQQETHAIVPANTPDSHSIMRLVEKWMGDPQFDVAKLNALLEMKERWEASEARKAFNVAFSSFKAEAVTIIKRTEVKDGPLKGKFHANLFDIVDATTPYLSKHGLAISWRLTRDEPTWMEVTCTLRHVGGHSESVSMGGAPDTGPGRNAIQARGSAKSYLERYTATAILGLAPKDADNDGNGGGKKEVEADPAGKKALEACGSLAALQEVWKKALTPEQRKTLAPVKDEMKAKIEAADLEAAK